MYDKLLFLYMILMLSCVDTLFSQHESETILTIENTEIPLSEYLMFKHLNDPDLSKTSKENRNAFVDYSLLLYEAGQQGCDTTGTYLSELEQYRDLQAQNYTNFDGLTDNDIGEYYSRLLKEIDISHIQIDIAGDLYSDTLAEYREIDSLLTLTRNGRNFNALAHDFSDSPSASDSGHLGYITGMQLSFPLEELAFSTPAGEISGILRTSGSYHLIKVHHERPFGGPDSLSDLSVKPFSEVKDKLIQAYKNNPSRQNYLRDKFLRDVMTRYGFNFDNEAYKKFVEYGRYAFREGKWIEPGDLERESQIFTIGDRDVTFLDFSQYLARQQFAYSIVNYPPVVGAYFQNFFLEVISGYNKTHLETRYPEFRAVMKVYSNALLLNCAENKIWETAALDTAGLKKTYRKNRDHYQVNGFDGFIIYFEDARSRQQLEFEIENSDLEPDELAEDLKNNHADKLQVERVRVKMGENAVVDHFIWKTSGFEKEYSLVIVKGKPVKLPAEHYSEVKSDVWIDFQKITKEKFIRRLRRTYSHTFDNKLLNSIQNQKRVII